MERIGGKYQHMRASDPQSGDEAANYPAISYDVQLSGVVAKLGEPAYTFVRDEARITVLEWSCGCSACASGENASVQWCGAHAIRASENPPTP